ncbi:probable serine/threonine-protein kinase roco4 [Anneissia japonica]|uniref:probable serine/threonine-protein kinase roco4 n=1 Tax=Anneissia japonica TaxID=1529436 RepID=UPI0014256606|nr:probable serine/threonine-protein kinase roco4 [Anneissia japonica]
MTLPAQIKARGKDAVTAFVNEIEKGEMTLVNSRVMFLGKEGAGKTSLVNSILGKPFNENEPSTCGILTTTVFQTVGLDYIKWEEHKDVDVCELTKKIREYNIAERIARKLEPPEGQETTSMSVSPSSTASPMETSEEATSLTSEEKETSDVSQSAANVQFDRLPEEIFKKVVANLDRQNPEPSRSAEEPKPGIFKRFFMKITRNKPTNKDARFERVVERVVENVPSDVTCIWDYAGQISYYITHRFFLTDGSSYVVAFSLFEPLNELAKSRGPLKDRFEMTNLQMIIFWIRSIYEHAVLQYNASTQLINDTIASPTISLVGTHKDKLEGSEENKQNQIEAIFKIIFEEIKGMPFELHVDRTMYAVDNTSANDKGIEELKKNLGGYTKQMAKTVPTKWVDFQSKIQEVGKTTLRMSLDEVNEIAVDCGIPNENTIHILNYLNDCGIIMYSPTNIKLKNTVITNVHMLIEIFTKVITTEDQRPAMMKLWHLLDKGILSETLLRHLWKHELEEDASSFDIFVELMKVFGLLFEKQTVIQCLYLSS